MKANKLTVVSNFRWESSRMVLSEHREEILEHNRTVNRKVQPELDEQEIDAFMLLIRDSITHRKVIKISLFDQYEDDLQIIGLVERIDQYRRTIRIEGESIKVDKAISVEMEN
jgi:hypothetical protein